MGILYTAVGFKTNPFDEMLPRHRVFHRSDCNMDQIAIQAANRYVFFPGTLCGSRQQLPHGLAAAKHRNALVAEHGSQVAAVIAAIKIVFQNGSSLYYRVVVIKAPLQGLCYTVRDAVDW